MTVRPEIREAMANSFVTVADDLMRRQGGNVPPPMLWALRGDHLVGMVTLRAARDGTDGMEAVVEMSTFAAAARATDVVVGWEQLDLAVLCGAPRGSELPAVQVCAARPDSHVLSTYPFTAEVATRRFRGTQVTPVWGMPRLGQVDAPLPSVIVTLLRFCWQPMTTPGADENSSAIYLRSLGYEVSLTA